MNIVDGMLPPGWEWSAHLLYAVVLGVAVWRAPWRELAKPGMLHGFLGASTLLMVLWSLQAGVNPGLGFHLLGATLLTLMFGWELAVVAQGIVLVAVTAYGMGGWHSFSMNALLTGVIPVAVSYGVYRAVDRWLPNNIFVYIFLCAFFGAGLAIAVSGFGSVGVLVASGVYSFEHVAYEYMPYFPLMVFPEAFVTGMLVTILVGFFPRWVWTFDDQRYLRPH
ncbi:MAG TPA: energy-coupling factor ABC transporter permease [Gammaproteobacteria bacterium]|nr:energy-coupling factor ABC transporter permease [Gammaproteobacteria bacterium]